MAIIIEGKEYESYQQLSNMCGVKVSTLINRHARRPDITLEDLLRQPDKKKRAIISGDGHWIPNTKAAAMCGTTYREFMRWKIGKHGATIEKAIAHFARYNPEISEKIWDKVAELEPYALGSYSRGTESKREHFERLCQLCGIDESFADEFERRFPNA